MSLSTSSLRAAALAVCAHEGVDVAGLARAELMRLLRDVDAVRKAADVLMALASAEVDRRSRVEDGQAGFARREGFRSTREMIAHATGSSLSEAQRLVDAGELLTDAEPDGPTETNTETYAVPTAPAVLASPTAAFRAELARRVREGSTGVDIASLFSNALDGLPDTEHTRDLFARALDKANGLPMHKVRALVWRAQAHSDPEAWAEREERQHEERSVAIRDDADGMVTISARLTPIAAAPVKAILDAGVRRAMMERRDNPASDPRTPWQMRADILTDMCQHMLDCDQPTSGVKTTIVLRARRKDVETGRGIGEIDGLAQPVSARLLRQRAADAEVIPAVLGREGEVLDWGRAKRLFTPTQRLALVERDGGCAWCNAPPSWCEAHHIQWWERDSGPTDLENGVLLCSRCHHRIHRDGWRIEIRMDAVEGAAPWFTPPRVIDPTQTAVPGGRAKFDLRPRQPNAA